MQWHELYPKEIIPEMDALADYMGEAKPLWLKFTGQLAGNYGVKPKLTYSVCSGKPGWNVKYQKSGQMLGTFYPEEGAFSALIVLSYKLDSAMEAILPELTCATAEKYRVAGDYMKMGKWMMLRIDTQEVMDDLLKIIAVKLASKG
jgi:hypothetical protein